MKVLITGADGMFGFDLSEYLDNIGCFVIPTNKETLDITNFKQAGDVIEKNRPDLIINCGAYTDVEKAEVEKELASKINTQGAKNIAILANKYNSTLIHISTDYVFDGKKKTAYQPKDKPNPINHYGLTKYQGELEVQKNCKKHYIVRTSWLYGKNGKNFVDTMLNLAQNTTSINVVDDQIGCPTWTYDLASNILKVLNKPYGIYHIASQGQTTWYNFSKEIFKIKGIKNTPNPISSKNYPQKALRPKYSVLNSDNICRKWEEMLLEYLNY
jgi:dTDP-4-dehydrorhamnose reductase